MIGFVLTKALILAFGYIYPAYECYKTVELNKPEIEQLRFWCQYWILVAMLTVFEWVGDTFISWLPMYSEAKLAFFVFLWYPKTKGTTYVYDTFFRPYVAKHESEIDRSLMELRTRAGDILVLYWQRAASYGQTRVFEILQYVAAQSPYEPAQPHRAQCSQPPQSRQVPPSPTAPLATTPPQVPQQAQVPSIPSKKLQEPTKSGEPSSAANASSSEPNSESNLTSSAPIEEETAPVEAVNTVDTIRPAQDAVMEDVVRVTRGRLRRRAGSSAAAAATS